MILQQEKKVSIWGNADPGENVTIKFQKQIKKVTADKYGNWSVNLDELQATNTPQQMVIYGKKNTVIFKNILIGEVWLVSGQSNMEYSMNNHPQYLKPKKGDPDFLQKEYKQANNPMIRVLYVEKNVKVDSLPTKGWQMIDEKSFASVSAIGYFFAKHLVDNLDIPIGIISSSWGGTPIETWMPKQIYLSSPILKEEINKHEYSGAIVGEKYEKMIKPIAPFSLKGFLWYQGETNLINGDRDIYAEKQKYLIEGWRSEWDNEELPFYYVQLAPYIYSQRRRDPVAKTWESLPYFWEIQTSCMNIPNTGMVVTTDLVDNPKDIHPSYKWIIGERLARWALAKNYNKNDLVYSGPTFKNMKVEDGKIILEFNNIGSGLITNDGKNPNWFYMKDEKGIFSQVNAIIKDNKIIIEEPISKPIIIRFAWDEIAMPNLFNKEGLPAIPFRTNQTNYNLNNVKEIFN